MILILIIWITFMIIFRNYPKFQSAMHWFPTLYILALKERSNYIWISWNSVKRVKHGLQPKIRASGDYIKRHCEFTKQSVFNSPISYRLLLTQRRDRNDLKCAFKKSFEKALFLIIYFRLSNPQLYYLYKFAFAWNLLKSKI